MHGYVPHPDDVLSAACVRSSPATVAVVELDGRLAERTYWRLDFPNASRRRPVSRAEARARVRQLVTEAVERRLVSDVPLGAFLSGGIDSTIVVGLMSRLTNEPVKTFSIGFEGDAAYDETAARAPGRRAVRHRPHRVPRHSRRRSIWSIADLAPRRPVRRLVRDPDLPGSELTRQHVTVVLTGDGGDEVFAGYLRFAAALAAERLPRALGAGAARGASARCRPRRTSGICSRARAASRASWTCRCSSGSTRWNSLFQDDLVGLLQPECCRRRRARCRFAAPARPAAGAALSPLSQLLAANFATYLPGDLLVKTDRCTMANSLEARCPLLDTALIEYVAGAARRVQAATAAGPRRSCATRSPI